VWPAAAADEVIAALSDGGAAITEGQILVVTKSGATPLPAPRGQTLDTEAFLLGPGPSAWRCRRETGERWPEYAARCAATAHARVAQLMTETEFSGEGALFVDLAWTTEDELTLFDLPGYVREEFGQAATRGRPPWGTYNGARSWDEIRVRLAGPTRGSFYGHPTDSLEGVDREARHIDLSGRAKDIARLAEFRSLEVLRVSDADDKALEIIGALPALRVLSLFGVRASHLGALTGLGRLELLDCRDARRVTDVRALARLERLRVLTIDVSGLRELSQLEALVQLRGLEILGGLLRLPTLEPVGRLTGLQYLTVGNVRVADQSLRPLAALTNLRSLDLIHNRFPFAEFAELAVALPDTEGPHRSPFVCSGLSAQLYACGTCGGSSGHVTLGKPSRSVCPVCDGERLQKHVARWEILVSAARARRTRS
jgi:hypothetical protein